MPKDKLYEFTVVMIGCGPTPEAAWTEAAEHAVEDSGDFCSTKDLPGYVEINKDGTPKGGRRPCPKT